MIQLSEGYVAAAREDREKIERSLDPNAIAFAESLIEWFEEGVTKQSREIASRKGGN